MFYENDIPDDKTRFIEMMTGPNPAEVWRLLAKDFATKCDQKDAEIARLRAALKPFADEVDLIGLHGNAPQPERLLMFASEGGGTFLGFTMKAIYDAAAAYQQPAPPEPKS